MADLMGQGFEVLLPVSHTSPFDLVAYRDGVFKRIQVKYRAASSGCVSAHFRRATVANGKATYRRMAVDEVDLMCIYCPDTDACYYVLANIPSIQLRVDGRATKAPSHAAEKFRSASSAFDRAVAQQ
jgi:hypothetical protein